MPLAVKNNALIVKDGKIAENCGCCGGWYCYKCPSGYDTHPGRYGTITASDSLSVSLGASSYSGDASLSTPLPSPGTKWRQLRTQVNAFNVSPIASHVVNLVHKESFNGFRRVTTYQRFSDDFTGLGPASYVNFQDTSVPDGRFGSFEVTERDIHGNVLAGVTKFPPASGFLLGIEYSLVLVITAGTCPGTVREVVSGINIAATWALSIFGTSNNTSTDIYTFLYLGGYMQNQSYGFDTKSLTSGSAILIQPIAEEWKVRRGSVAPFSQYPTQDMSCVFVPSQTVLEPDC
jgi:hypothetical protein